MSKNEWADLICGASVLVLPLMYLGIPLILGILARAIYRTPSAKATTKCSVCGKLQPPECLARCMICGRLFCLYPSGKSPQEQWDDVIMSVGGVVGGILLCVGTALSILGGVLVVISLAAFFGIPYLIFRLSLPGSCGGDVYGPLNATYRTQLLGKRCKKCGGALAASYPPSESSSSYDDTRAYRDDARDYIADRHHRDRDDDHDRGSIWDGWLVKWDD